MTMYLVWFYVVPAGNASPRCNHRHALNIRKAQALQHIGAAIKSETCAYVLTLLMEANKVLEEHLQDLLGL